MKGIPHARQGFQGVQQQRRGGAQQIRGLAGNNPAVRQLHGGGRVPGLLRPGQRFGHHLPLRRGHPRLLHQKLQLADSFLTALALLLVAQSHVKSADDLLAGGFPHRLVIHDAVAHHVDAHIRGRLVGAAAQNLFKDGHQHRESLHIPVVVHSGDSVGIQVEGVYHVHIVQVRGSRLIGKIHRMIQWDVPDGEGLKLRIACVIAPLVLMVQLAQAGGQLAAAGAGSGHHHERPGGFDVLVPAKALIADNPASVGGVAGDAVVMVHPNSQRLQSRLEGPGNGLPVKPGQYHAGNIEPEAPEHVNQPDHVPVVGNSQIPPDFVLFYVVGIDDNHHLHLILQLQQHPEFAVRLEARQHPGRVVVIIELAAEFQIQLSSKSGNPLPDVFRLHLQVMVIVKSLTNHFFQPLFPEITVPHYIGFPAKRQ